MLIGVGDGQKTRDPAVAVRKPDGGKRGGDSSVGDHHGERGRAVVSRQIQCRIGVAYKPVHGRKGDLLYAGTIVSARYNGAHPPAACLGKVLPKKRCRAKTG